MIVEVATQAELDELELDAIDVASMVTLGDKVKVPTLRCLYEVTMEGDKL